MDERSATSWLSGDGSKGKAAPKPTSHRTSIEEDILEGQAVEGTISVDLFVSDDEGGDRAWEGSESCVVADEGKDASLNGNKAAADGAPTDVPLETVISSGSAAAAAAAVAAATAVAAAVGDTSLRAAQLLGSGMAELLMVEDAPSLKRTNVSREFLQHIRLACPVWFNCSTHLLVADAHNRCTETARSCIAVHELAAGLSSGLLCE
jgi:hypothetical protein